MVTNHHMKKLFAVPLLLFLFGATQLVAQTQFIAKADRYTLGKHEDFTVTFTINEQASGFEAPAFANFTVLQGPSRSQSTIMRNYQTEFNLTFTYVLRPKKVGTYTVEAAKIKVGREVFETKPLEIKVVESSPKTDNPTDPANLAKNAAYSRIRVSKRNVYVGEPFVATYQVVTRVNVGNPTILENPQYTGAYKAELNLGNDIKPETEVIAGTPYNVFTIKKDLIVPQKAGTFAPGTLVMELPTQLPTNQYDFFGRQYVQTVKQISEANFPVVTVKALPTANKPADFSGAVGQYKMEVSLSRQSVKANESVSLNIQISGLGNVKLVEVPTPELPSALEAFDPKISDKVRETAKGMEGSKAYEYLLIPRYKGVYKIPPIRFSFFDPVAERYQVLESAALEVEVTDGPAAIAGAPGSNGGMPKQEKERVEFIGKDILFIKTQPGQLRNARKPLLEQPIFKVLLAIPFALMLLGFLGFLVAQRRNNDSAAVASRAASKAVKQRLGTAQQALQQNQVAPFYQALSHALWAYFEARLQLPKSQHTQEALLEKLTALQVAPAERNHLRDLLRRCEQAQYGLGASSNMAADYDLAASFITKLLK